MTDQQPEDPFEPFMRHVTDHGCDRKSCKIAQDLALKAITIYSQLNGLYDQESKDD